MTTTTTTTTTTPVIAGEEVIIMGCTTIPSRLEHLANAIDQAKKQKIKPNIFCIGIPRYSSREKCAYDLDKVEDIAKKSEAPFEIKISLLYEDYGPLCKLAGMLAIAPENAILITIDDDQVYDEKLVETLLAGYHEANQESVVCLCGHALGRIVPKVYAWGYRRTGFDNNGITNAFQLRSGSDVDIISGWAGVLYNRRFFGDGTGLFLPNDLEMYRRTNGIKGLHRNDDLYISAWLSSLRIRRVVTKYKGDYQQKTNKDINSINPLCFENNTSHVKGHLVHFRNWWRVINDLCAKGYFARTAYVPPYKSLLVISTTALIVVIGTGIFAGYTIVKTVKK